LWLNPFLRLEQLTREEDISAKEHHGDARSALREVRDAMEHGQDRLRELEREIRGELAGTQTVLLAQVASSSATVEAACDKRLGESIDAVMTRLERLSLEFESRVSETQIMIEAERSRRLEVEVELSRKVGEASSHADALPNRVKELEQGLGAHRELLDATKYAVEAEVKALIYKERTARVSEVGEMRESVESMRESIDTRWTYYYHIWTYNPRFYSQSIRGGERLLILGRM